MLSNTQSYSKIPLILTCDEEGGARQPADEYGGYDIYRADVRV